MDIRQIEVQQRGVRLAGIHVAVPKPSLNDCSRDRDLNRDRAAVRTECRGVTMDCAEWLAEHALRAAGTDMIAFNQIVPGAGHSKMLAHYVLLVKNRIQIIEVFNLEELAWSAAGCASNPATPRTGLRQACGSVDKMRSGHRDDSNQVRSREPPTHLTVLAAHTRGETLRIRPSRRPRRDGLLRSLGRARPPVVPPRCSTSMPASSVSRVRVREFAPCRGC